MPEHQQLQQSKKPNTIFQKQTTPVTQTPVSNPYPIIQRAKINPKSLTCADIMQLQRTIGNRAVGRLLSGTGNTSIAQQAPIQREESQEEVEELLQGKMTDTVQRQGSEDEEELMQGKMTEPVQMQENPEEREPLQTKRDNNTGMPDNLKAGVENLSGIDMSDVRVHYNSSKPAEVGALAYTQGIDIHVAPGQERHLPHEAWHVVQQKQGRVQATTQMKGLGINDNPSLEHEADMMGAKMAQFVPAPDEKMLQGKSGEEMMQKASVHSRSGQEKRLAHKDWHMMQQKQSRMILTEQMKGLDGDEGLVEEAEFMSNRPKQLKFASKSSKPSLALLSRQLTSATHRLSKALPDDTPLGQLLISGRPIQRTLADLQEAEAGWMQYLDLERRVHENIVIEGQALYRDPHINTPNSFPDKASKGLKHDVDEINSKAGGFLFQQIVKGDLRSRNVSARSGTDNNQESDIVGATGENFEVKRYKGDNVSNAMWSALEQFQKRGSTGTIVLATTGVDSIAAVKARVVDGQKRTWRDFYPNAGGKQAFGISLADGDTEDVCWMQKVKLFTNDIPGADFVIWLDLSLTRDKRKLLVTALKAT